MSAIKLPASLKPRMSEYIREIPEIVRKKYNNPELLFLREKVHRNLERVEKLFFPRKHSMMLKSQIMRMFTEFFETGIEL